MPRSPHRPVRIIHVVAALGAALALAACGSRQEESAAPPASAAAAPAPTAPLGTVPQALTEPVGTERAPSGELSVDGAVVVVDAAARTLLVHGTRGDVTLAWDEHTTVAPGGRTPADLRAGSNVTVQYAVANGRNLAVAITVHRPVRTTEQG